MKWSASTLAAALLLVASSSSSSSSVEAFTPTTSISSRSQSRNQVNIQTILATSKKNIRHQSSIIRSQLNMSSSASYTVGIVGATGAVGKEIRNCLEIRGFPVSTLRIFGSERSAGSKIETEKYGTITVELFDVAAAKQCDVVFLAVSGDFSLEHARALSDGADGCVVIDNSVRTFFFAMLHFYIYSLCFCYQIATNFAIAR
jgi:Semialdehyde dehydrogenase, NAD binding domain